MMGRLIILVCGQGVCAEPLRRQRSREKKVGRV